MHRQCDHRKAFANSLTSKKGIPVNFQIDSGSTCSILPVGVYKEISGDRDLWDLNTTVRPSLSLYDEKLKSKHREPKNVFCSTLQLEKKGSFSLELLMRT